MIEICVESVADSGSSHRLDQSEGKDATIQSTMIGKHDGSPGKRHVRGLAWFCLDRSAKGGHTWSSSGTDAANVGRTYAPPNSRKTSFRIPESYDSRMRQAMEINGGKSQ